MQNELYESVIYHGVELLYIACFYTFFCWPFPNLKSKLEINVLLHIKMGVAIFSGTFLNRRNTL